MLKKQEMNNFTNLGKDIQCGEYLHIFEHFHYVQGKADVPHYHSTLHKQPAPAKIKHEHEFQCADFVSSFTKSLNSRIFSTHYDWKRVTVAM